MGWGILKEIEEADDNNNNNKKRLRKMRKTARLIQNVHLTLQVSVIHAAQKFMIFYLAAPKISPNNVRTLG